MVIPQLDSIKQVVNAEIFQGYERIENIKLPYPTENKDQLAWIKDFNQNIKEIFLLLIKGDYYSENSK